MKRVWLLVFLLLPASPGAQARVSIGREGPVLANVASRITVERVDSSRGPSRARRIAIGVSIGAILGGAIGYGVGKASCSSNPACDAPGPEYAGGLLGIVAGGTVGALIAYPCEASPTRQQSIQAPKLRPIVKVSIPL